MYDLPATNSDGDGGTLVDIIDDDDLELMWEEVEAAMVRKGGGGAGGGRGGMAVRWADGETWQFEQGVVGRTKVDVLVVIIIGALKLQGGAGAYVPLLKTALQAGRYFAWGVWQERRY